MKTNPVGLISAAISGLVLAVAASSRGQELNIDVPVPPVNSWLRGPWPSRRW